ncbi:Uncharacterised protein [Nocardia africana]|uniref:Uncharacterized protein n=1 Tax=Nocardia africana TaxID=134964 RepID=A0A378WWP7_9NOCA|nr:Uncharacterised protein [Nocardia africana]
MSMENHQPQVVSEPGGIAITTAVGSVSVDL